MAVQRKQILINVYDPVTATRLATWTHFTFGGFTKALDSGPAECVIRTDQLFDYGAADLLLGNDIEIRIADKDTVSSTNPSDMASRVIYRGYISLIERDADGPTQTVQVHLLGYYTLLALDVLKNAAQTSLYTHATAGLTTTIGSIAAADTGLIMRTILDRYIAETTNPKISYDIDDIPNTSTTVQYSFKQRTYRDALDAVRKMSPSGLFYYINEVGKVKFKPKPSTPTHKFVFGRHFKKVHVEHSLEKVRNYILIWDGKTSSPTYKHYQNDASIIQYGRRAQTDNDYGATSGSMDQKGARFLADNALPDVKVICTVIDNNADPSLGYDIESIQPGDTCSFYGFAPGFDDIFQDNMIITQVAYTLYSAEITVEIIKSSLIDTQDSQGQMIDQISAGGLSIPESYT